MTCRAPRRVCIIGAGPAGLSAAHQLQKELGHGAISLTLYEKYPTVGGTWAYDNSDEHTTGIYADMRTNLPKEIMEFDGVTFDDTTAKGASFLTREQVHDYWKRYSAAIRPFIKFSHTVVDLSRDSERNKWLVEVENSSNSSSSSTEAFDAVFVCNGHFTAPHLPEFAEKYTKKAIHSHCYKGVSGYEDAVVAIVGMNPSGKDIGMQLAKVAKKVYLLHRTPSADNTFFGALPANCVEAATPVDACVDALILPDGSKLANIDVVIYCTGYRFAFPFIRPEAGILALEEGGSVVTPLFAHFAHANHLDSLFFIGLNYTGFLPCIVFHWQIRAAVALLSHKLQVSEHEVERFNRDRLAEMATEGTPPRHFHQLTEHTMWPYVEYLYALCQRAGTLAVGERPYRPVQKAIFMRVIEQLIHNIAHCKEFIYTAVSDDEYTVVSTSAEVFK